MSVKLLMQWDIKTDREPEYFEFVVSEFIPSIKKLGLTDVEFWYTAYGENEQILFSGNATDLSFMEEILQSPEWGHIYDKLVQFVENLSQKLVVATGGFQY